MLDCLLNDQDIVQLVTFLVGCLIIRLVCYLFSGLCALLFDYLAAYVWWIPRYFMLPSLSW